MTTKDRAKLIEMVKMHKCLYDPNQQYYNYTQKSEIWNKIGKEIGVDGKKAKYVWRSMRDGYMRHKKQLNGIYSGYPRNYTTYKWSTELSFLDKYLYLISANKKRIQPESPSSETSTHSVLVQHSPPQLATSENFIDEQKPQELSGAETESAIKIEKCESPSSETSTHSVLLQQSSPSQVATLVHFIDEPKPPEPSDSLPQYESDEDMEVNYINPKRRREENDSIDHLFTSYAKTFKTLSPRNQANMKVSLAKLFAEAELRELDSC